MVASAQCVHIVSLALKRRGRTIVRVHGRSMYPILRDGMRLEVQSAAYEDLRIGDLVVYHNGSGIICRRLIRKAGRLCLLKGDMNIFADPPVIWPQVLGRVTRIIDDKRHIHSLESARARRLGALLARFSYVFALCLNAGRAVKGCRWWPPGIEWTQ